MSDKLKLKLDDLQSDGGLLMPESRKEPVHEEHRHSARKLIDTEGTLNGFGGSIPVRTVDISLGGLCIRAPKQLPVGNAYSLEFALDVDGGIRQFVATIDVVYCFYTVERDYKVGVEFLDPSPDMLQAIAHFLGVTSI